MWKGLTVEKLDWIEIFFIICWKDTYVYVFICYFCIRFNLYLDETQLLRGKRPAVHIILTKEDKDALQLLGVRTTVCNKFFLAQREHPRCQKYTCCEIDTNKSVVSSIVAGLFTTSGTSANKLGEGYLFFGQVLYFLLCQIGSSPNKFAKVEWKSAPTKDPEVQGLWKIEHQDVPYKTTIIPISKLSSPYTTAIDIDNNLWILDFSKKYVQFIE